MIKILFILILMSFLSACSSTINRPDTTEVKPEKSEAELIKSATKVTKVTKDRGCTSPYIVRSGDTLSGIALKCNVNMNQLALVNNLVNPYLLFVGQELRILEDKKTFEQQLLVENIKTYWNWPMDKDIKYKYVRDVMDRYAIVFYSAIGKEVKSVASGEVVYSGAGMQHYGKMVVVRHADNYLTVYAHNSSLKVQKGQEVKKGQVIALSGQTGDVNKPKLYFEIRHFGRKLDARKVLRSSN